MLDDYEPLVTTLAIRVPPLILKLSLRFRTKLPITTCNVSALNAKMFACGSSLLPRLVDMLTPAPPGLSGK